MTGFHNKLAILKVSVCTHISVDQWEMLANKSLMDTWRPQWLSVEMTDIPDAAQYKKILPALIVLGSNTPKAWLSGLDLVKAWQAGLTEEQLPVKAMLARCRWLEVWLQGSWVQGQQQLVEGILKKAVDGQGRVARLEVEEEGGVIRVVS